MAVEKSALQVGGKSGVGVGGVEMKDVGGCRNGCAGENGISLGSGPGHASLEVVPKKGETVVEHLGRPGNFRP